MRRWPLGLQLGGLGAVWNVALSEAQLDLETLPPPPVVC